MQNLNNKEEKELKGISLNIRKNVLRMIKAGRAAEADKRNDALGDRKCVEGIAVESAQRCRYRGSGVMRLHHSPSAFGLSNSRNRCFDVREAAVNPGRKTPFAGP